ncbi:hypothetical protein KR222_000985, partial [Zaprionus bogoriensis]
QSQSSSSRRVMWKVRDGEEEVFDSVVNYRRMAPATEDDCDPNAEREQSGNNKSLDTPPDDKQSSVPEKKSSTSLGLTYKPSRESVKDLSSSKRARIVGNWHRLFDRMRHRSSPNLALRYKPSHESLKKRRSKDLLTECSTSKSRSSTSRPKLATGDLKLETGFFPPYQTAVVREVAPTFAQRMYIPDDTDSVCSGTIELRIPLVKSARPRTAPIASSDVGDMQLPATPESLSLISQLAKSGNSKGKRRTNRAAASSSSGGTSKATGGKAATGSGNNGGALPTLRQRQQELHRYRVLIEKRRLELLDLKIVRERADSLRHEILFHKDLQLKHNQIKSYEDNNSSQA